ncbi:MAG: ABC transporter substrate-binding protein [Deltaproteobacteria bacterium]|nr:ABC transporter substrate-binding protein [Deltaproteobacteria bacterium]
MASKLLRLLSAILIGAMSSSVIPARAAEAPQKIRFAYASRSNIVTPKHIAQSRGYFKAEGLEVEMIQMNPRLSATAIINGDVTYADAFTSTFRGMMQGFPIKLVMVHQKKGPYFLIARPDIKDIQQLKGKRLGVATLRGSDHLVADELMLAKGFNPAAVQPIVIGDASMRYQAMVGGIIDVVAVATPHDLMLRQKGFSTLAGPPEVGVPGAGVFTPEKFLRENSLVVRKTLRALLRAQHYILENRHETIQALLQWLPQSPEVAAHSYDYELKGLSRDGLMTDAELDALMVKLGDKKRPIDEVRDFSLARQALKELESGK